MPNTGQHQNSSATLQQNHLHESHETDHRSLKAEKQRNNFHMYNLYAS